MPLKRKVVGSVQQSHHVREMRREPATAPESRLPATSLGAVRIRRKQATALPHLVVTTEPAPTAVELAKRFRRMLGV